MSYADVYMAGQDVAIQKVAFWSKGLAMPATMGGVGALGGGAAGAAIDDDNRVRGALIGALLGLGTGVAGAQGGRAAYERFMLPGGGKGVQAYESAIGPSAAASVREGAGAGAGAVPSDAEMALQALTSRMRGQEASGQRAVLEEAQAARQSTKSLRDRQAMLEAQAAEMQNMPFSPTRATGSQQVSTRPSDVAGKGYSGAKVVEDTGSGAAGMGYSGGGAVEEAASQGGKPGFRQTAMDKLRAMKNRLTKKSEYDEGPYDHLLHWVREGY